MPALGLGTWRAGKGEVYGVIREAIRIGYRHFDCAYIYNNQKEIGLALHDAMEAGDVNRKELWITSKLWNTHHRAEDVIVALKHTLHDLKLQYLDLFLIHWPAAQHKGTLFPQRAEDLISLEELPLNETWQGMEECVMAGLSKHIGVSNFSQKKIKSIQKEAKISIEVNQVESHPYFQQKALLKYCQKGDIILTAYAPLGPPERAKLLAQHEKPFLADSPIVAEIAARHQSTQAQVLIAWALQRNSAVIPKSSNVDRLKENFVSIHLELTAEDMATLATLDSGYRYEQGTYLLLPDSGYSYEQLWDE